MRHCVFILLLGCSITPAVCAQGTDDRAVQSKIIALEQAFKVLAYQNKDTKTINSILDDNFVLVNEHGGLQTRAEFLLFVHSADSLSYKAGAMIVKLHGETAVVTGLYELKGVIKGKPFRHQGRFVDTWLQKSGQWVAIASLSVAAP